MIPCKKNLIWITKKRNVLRLLVLTTVIATITQTRLLYNPVLLRVNLIKTYFAQSDTQLPFGSDVYGKYSMIPETELVSPAKNGYEQLKHKLPDSFAVNLTGKTVDFAPPPHVFPLTIKGNPYYLRNKNVCDIKQELTFLVMVHTAVSHFLERQAIRETWANKEILSKNRIKIVFLLGKPSLEDNQVDIEDEMGLYEDIVQGNFLDSYRNLTQKAVMSVRWVVENCMNTKLIIKIDDDVFIPIFHFIEKARKVWSKETKSIHCLNQIAKLERTGQWPVDPEYFKGMTHYPFRNCMGFAQVMTSDMFPSLLEAAKETPFFWIDDIYLTGLLVNKVGGVTFFKPDGRPFLTEEKTLECFNQANKKTCEIFVGHAKTPGFMQTIWNLYLSQNKRLAAKYFRKL